MERFTKDEMFNELRTIFLFEADHIILGASEDMAEQFIGFENMDGQYCYMDPELVDLARFDITRLFDQGYDYAFRPSLLHTLHKSEVKYLVAFMKGTPRIGGTDSAGEIHQFMNPDGYCQTIADAVHARWKLERSSGGATFTTRELALLANMTEGAVRNAMADKSESGLKAIPGSKPVLVGIDEAKRWLSGRRGYIAMPARPREDAVLHEMLAAARTAKDLGLVVSKHHLLITNHSSTDRFLSAGFSPEEMKAWEDGTFQFEAERAAKLAEVLDLEVPSFVGKALEVSLRRDRAITEADQA
ncbi:hypothetical protein ILT44_22530 [Microvirga sp. BT689]|uniref:hypothetical protein n=1 Tax=Microvirga arvi TaxID=2778731 RepID=UPI001950367C|nr:hypothetical protein [Microvirga arvi]MBM6582984.1 hypothetical protein [Microvirga arvi]